MLRDNQELQREYQATYHSYLHVADSPFMIESVILYWIYKYGNNRFNDMNI